MFLRFRHFFAFSLFFISVFSLFYDVTGVTWQLVCFGISFFLLVRTKEFVIKNCEFLIKTPEEGGLEPPENLRQHGLFIIHFLLFPPEVVYTVNFRASIGFTIFWSNFYAADTEERTSVTF